MYLFICLFTYYIIYITSIYIYMVYGVDIMKYVWYMVYLGNAVPVD